MIVATAAHADLPGIMALEQEFTRAGWSEQSWADELAADGRCTLVEKDAAGAIRGVATFSVVEDVADLNRVVVAPDARRAGIGRRLVLAGLEWVDGMGAQQVMLEVEAGNDPAIALYEQVGFVALARRANYYGAGADALVMALPLGRES